MAGAERPEAAERPKTRVRIWRPRPELNRGTRICSPLRHHSATWPQLGADLSLEATGRSGNVVRGASRMRLAQQLYCRTCGGAGGRGSDLTQAVAQHNRGARRPLALFKTRLRLSGQVTSRGEVTWADLSRPSDPLFHCSLLGGLRKRAARHGQRAGSRPAAVSGGQRAGAASGEGSGPGAVGREQWGGIEQTDAPSPSRAGSAVQLQRVWQRAPDVRFVLAVTRLVRWWLASWSGATARRHSPAPRPGAPVRHLPAGRPGRALHWMDGAVDSTKRWAGPGPRLWLMSGATRSRRSTPRSGDASRGER